LAKSGFVFFSIDLTYLFLNFHVGVRQQGFWIKELTCIGKNLFLATLGQIVACGDSG